LIKLGMAGGSSTTRYVLTKATAPTSGMVEGTLWYDTTGNALYTYTGAAWVAVASVGGTLVKQGEITTTANFGTASTTFVDITNLTGTITGLTAAKNYFIVAVMNIAFMGVGADSLSNIRLMIDGTGCPGSGVKQDSVNNYFGLSCNGSKAVTGSTSYIVKGQLCNPDAETTTSYYAANFRQNAIQYLVFEV